MKKSLITLPALLLAAAPAFSQTVIDFEGPTSFASILDYYAGGTDSAGASGPNLGVSFGGDALALRNDELGPYFSNAPSPVGVMVPVGDAAVMNVAAGFTGAVSFWYSSSDLVISAVNVYSGLDATGTLLASFNLVPNAQANCSDSPFCRFDQLSSSFAGVASSISFSAATGFAGFDDVSISVVPEPASLALMGLGVAGLLAWRRRAA